MSTYYCLLKCYFFSVTQTRHEHSETQDLPVEWPKKAGNPEEDSATASKAKISKAAKAKAKAKTEPKSDSSDQLLNKTMKTPSLLTNLVRCGNQMGLSSSWKFAEHSLNQQIHAKLKILPLSQLSAQQKSDNEKANIQTLTLLGIWQTTEQLAGCKKTAMMESAEELIEILFRISFFVNLNLI